ncbi:MAG: hypothetical protein EBZ13_04445 [Planctomycetia bacterium]|nr:hypothetical protein [Planctomycetia bacterium]
MNCSGDHSTGCRRWLPVALRRHLLLLLAGLAGGSGQILASPPEIDSIGRGLGAATIRAPAGGSEIVIRTTSRLAGAIDSLTWNGQEFIDSTDHGRQLQSASNLDVGESFFAECFNPTEAGSMHDGAGPTSSSRLLWLSAAGRELITVNQMAFWLRPGESSGGHLRIGAAGLDHAIRYRVSYTLPAGEPHRRATFELLTGYMPPAFREFFVLKPSGQLKPLDDGPGEQPLPVVVSTASGEHAMGVWSPAYSQTLTRPATYGRFWFPEARVSKWNCVIRERSAESALLKPGSYRYLVWVAVGSREQVRQTLQTLRSREAKD